LSMARTESDPSARVALLAGVLSNGVLKLVVAVGMGGGRFRRLAGTGLGVLALASALGLVWSHT